MASLTTQRAMASLPPPAHRWKYDVFLSFRGEDTRKNFVDHLYAGLDRQGIYSFKDDEKLERGKQISPELVKAIEQSMFSIIIFSRNYAFSGWCLDELAKIIECTETMGQTALPVFYDVDPSDVQNQKGIFAEAFHKHDNNDFKDDAAKVDKWRAALTKAAKLPGYDLRERHESEFIQVIAKEILSKLNRTLLHVDNDLVGIDSHVEKIISLLSIGSDDVRFVGLWGLGGIGKTTAAKVVYNHIYHQFEGRSYLANVREESAKHNLASLQNQLLSDTMMERDLSISNVDSGSFVIKTRLCCKKVLVILDDVDQLDQLEKLAGDHDWFGSGSRIIITTRDEHLLDAHRVVERYEVQKLNNDDSLELFSLKAFKHNHPAEDFLELSNQVANCAKGLPLALRVLGSFLFGRSLIEWRSAADKLKKIPNRKIMDVLKISFDGLEETEKEMFLDIACFFKGKGKDYATKILDSCGFYPDIGIKVLIEKSLITILDNKLSMHDLIQEMGWDIVRQVSPKEPGKRSRLWLEDDIRHVLQKNKGTEAVEAIILDLSREEWLYLKSSAEVFKKMNRLRLLKIHDVSLPGGLEYLPNELRYIDWHEYPLKYIPSSFQPTNLVELNMCYSRIEQLWKGMKVLDKLNSVDLSHSCYLTKTPDFTGAPNLEKLVLQGCTRLFEVHSSIGFLKRLMVLNLRDCKNLRTLPGIIQLESLKILVVSGCSKLEMFPEILGNMENLSELSLDETAIRELPSSFENLNSLVLLSMRNCKNLVSLPSSIWRLTTLKNLILSGCSKLGELPEDLGKAESLVELRLNGTAITQVPSSIVLLKNLRELSFGKYREGPSRPWNSIFTPLLLPRNRQDCMALQLPSLSGLHSLVQLDLSDCNLTDGAILGDLCFLSSLKKLNLSRNNFVTIPSGISQLPGLTNLQLCSCKRLKVLPELPSSIIYIDAENCTSLERLSYSSTTFRLPGNFIRFRNCPKLADNNCSVTDTYLQFRLQTLYSSPEMEQFSILLPGNDIPRWFNHQSVGSSICIPLPPSWCHSKRKGLALCALIGDRGVVQELPGFFWYSIRFKTDGSDSYSPGTMTSGSETKFIKSVHVWMHYMRWGLKCFENDENRSTQLNIFFDFGSVEVKKCGVRLVCEDDENDQMTGSTSTSTSVAMEILTDVEDTTLYEECKPSVSSDLSAENPHLKQSLSCWSCFEWFKLDWMN